MGGCALPFDKDSGVVFAGGFHESGGRVVEEESGVLVFGELDCDVGGCEVAGVGGMAPPLRPVEV